MSAPVRERSAAARPAGGGTITELVASYRAGERTPSEVLRATLTAIDASDPTVFIDRLEPALVLERVAALEDDPSAEELPLYGVPFAVKDNIDVAGRSTTAACPGFATTARRSATAVRLLEAAGAVLVGKTNLDQFATGLVGTRSPYGVPVNPLAPDHVPGGSSSGSAVAVAAGLVPFALGTDTAGSGRVPAAMTGTIGLKPTRGLVSTSGVVPACRSLDCVSVFTRTIADAETILRVLDRFDTADAYARVPGERTIRPADELQALRVGVPTALDIDPPLAAAFATHVERLRVLGIEPVPVELAPFARAGQLLYDGPWLAERLAGVGPFLAEHPDAVLDVTRAVLEGGHRFTAADAFAAADELARLRREVDAVFGEVDVLALPSVPSLLRLADVAADPIGTNATLGRFTNFVNLLDLAAVAAPAERVDGVPVGITLLGPALTDLTLLEVADAFVQCTDSGRPAPPGRTDSGRPAPPGRTDPPGRTHAPGRALLAVVGAHLRGQPLHHQLVTAGARLVARTVTAPTYRLYRLPGGAIAKPALVEAPEGGAHIEVEVYELPRVAVPVLRTAAAAPLTIGPVTLADGSIVDGYLGEASAVDPTRDITGYGGWRAYLAATDGGEDRATSV